MKNKKFVGSKMRSVLAGVTLAAASAVSQAQMAIPLIGDFGGLGAFGNLPGLGASGGMPNLDVAGSLMPNLDINALQQMLDPASIGDPTAYMSALTGVLAIAQSPGTFTPVPLAPPLARGFVPGFFVLYEAPETLAGYFLGGGSIFDSSLVALPSVPLLSAPLPLGVPFGELPALPVGDFGFPSPQEVLNQILSAAP